ncbi:hypothetical protein J6590_072476 [Homalodisca vitripennis]|nr:hypothetical protein J6590_072476 [Homalodisca vitripennis]
MEQLFKRGAIFPCSTSTSGITAGFGSSMLPHADVKERKTSLEIVPISKISNSRGADQKYKLNCNGKAIMYRGNAFAHGWTPCGLPLNLRATESPGRNPLDDILLITSQIVLTSPTSDHIIRFRTLFKNHLGLSQNGFVLKMRGGGGCNPGMRMSRMVRSCLPPGWRLITGHLMLKQEGKHLHIVGIPRDDPLCTMCDEQKETAEHLLFDCPAIARERYAIFDSLDKGGEFPREDLIGCFRQVRKRPLRFKCMAVGRPIEEEEDGKSNDRKCFWPSVRASTLHGW